MGRGGRRGQQGRAGQRGAGQRERDKAERAAELTPEQQTALTALDGQIASMAERLRASASVGREAMLGALSPVTEAEEPVALAFVQGLGGVRGERAEAAADLTLALGEADARREVAREARRSRLRLGSAGARPSVALPAASVAISVEASAAASGSPPSLAVVAPGPEAEAEAPSTAPFTPKLVEAVVTRSRESGEVTLVLGWQESGTSELLRGTLFALDFWRDGVKGFILTDALSRRDFARETTDKLKANGTALVPVTWAQARRLIQDALAVNAWRMTEPAAEFTEHRALVEERLLAEPGDEERRAAITEEEERLAREGDRPFIATDMEADETIANWLGAWSFGDYGVAYDFLAEDAPLRRKQPRAEYIAERRAWAGEAGPGALRLTLVREQARRASALWTPGTAGALGGAGADHEAFWSLALKDSPLAGVVDELPMSTLTSAESGRHWYWSAYTMRRDRTYGLWLIAGLRDEGAASQTLTLEELRQRIKEAHEAAEKAAEAAPPDPRSPQAVETVRAVTGALCAALHYRDAVIVKLPLDETAYREAVDDARTLSNHERAAALLEKMVGRFADMPRRRFELAIEEYLVGEQHASQGLGEGAAEWLDRAIATLERVVAEERTAEHLQALGEVLARRGHMTQAQQRLREAITLDPTRASAHADLASAIMAHVSGEDLDAPGPPAAKDERMAAARVALAELRQAAQLDGNVPHVFTRIGALYDLLGQQEDARLAFEEAISRDPGDAEAHYALGSLFLQRREPQRAAHPLETAVQLEPLAVPFHLALAGCYAALERKREATRELDTIEKLQPHLPQVAELRAIVARLKK